LRGLASRKTEFGNEEGIDLPVNAQRYGKMLANASLLESVLLVITVVLV
jgi:hypothetical protein